MIRLCPCDGLRWTLYDRNGNVVDKKFRKKVISDTEWYYEAWFESDAGYYLVEKVPDGYQARYENTGANADVTDRCLNGGTIVNCTTPRTGDRANLPLWLGCVLAGAALLGLLLLRRKRSAG